MGRNIETVKASLLLTFVFCPNVDKTKTIRQSARCLFWSFWFGNGRKMATTACFSGYTPQLIKALLFEAVFKRLSEASLRSAALAGSIFIDWSFSDKIFVSRRNFLKTIRSPVESVWERNPLASTAFCGFSSSALITADNLPGRVLCVAKQQDHLGSLSFGHSCAGILNISFWILIWLLWCEPAFPAVKKHAASATSFTESAPRSLYITSLTSPDIKWSSLLNWKHPIVLLFGIQGSSPESHHHNNILQLETTAQFLFFMSFVSCVKIEKC